jgi:hypothetical protein
MLRPTLDAVRAVGAEFGRRALRPLIVLGAIVAVLLLAGGGWLTVVNPWWWFLEAALILIVLVFVAAAVAARIALRVAEPPQNAEQRQAVASFVDKMQRVAENLHTPQLVILYRVVRDTVRPRANGFIETVARDSKSLAPDFRQLLERFSTERERSRP